MLNVAKAQNDCVLISEKDVTFCTSFEIREVLALLSTTWTHTLTRTPVTLTIAQGNHAVFEGHVAQPEDNEQRPRGLRHQVIVVANGSGHPQVGWLSGGNCKEKVLALVRGGFKTNKWAPVQRSPKNLHGKPHSSTTPNTPLNSPQTRSVGNCSYSTEPTTWIESKSAGGGATSRT